MAAVQSQWASTSAQVTRAIDGEAIEVKIGDRAEIVRYIGISTPEIQLPTRGGERYGEAAKAANARLATGKNVQLVFDIQRRDRFGRLLAYVYAGDSFLRDAASGPTRTPRSIIGPGRPASSETPDCRSIFIRTTGPATFCSGIRSCTSRARSTRRQPDIGPRWTTRQSLGGNSRF